MKRTTSLDDVFKIDDVAGEHAIIVKENSTRGHTATKGEINRCAQPLKEAIHARGAKYVLLVGNAALQAVTGSSGIKKRRGVPLERDGVVYLPTYSPGIVSHDPNAQALIDYDRALFDRIIDAGGIPRETKLTRHTVRNERDFQLMLDSLSGTVSFDIETNSLYPWQTHNDKGERDPARITMIGFGTSRGEFSIPWKRSGSPWSDDALDDMVARITDKLEDCFVVTHHGKFDMLWMAVHHGVWWRNDFDTMIASYLLDENRRHGLKLLAQQFCGAPNWDVDSDTKKEGPIDKQALYHAHDLYYTRQLRFIFGRELKKDAQVKRVFDRILMPVARMFTEIEFDGVYVDMSKYEDAKNYLQKELADAKKELNKFGDIDWGSPQQLSKYFFETLKLPIVEKTKKGKASVSESVLNRIDHPAAGAIIRYRGARQQLSFFIDGWKPFLHVRRLGGKKHYFLHPSFKIIGTVTGRLSCEHPNLQQVPRDPRIRSLISAEPGWTLIECDLSQIELRIAAELSRDRAMMHAFLNGIDVHWLTALREIERGGGLKELVVETASKAQGKAVSYAEAFAVLLKIGPDKAVEINKDWKEYRKKAKAVNFGYLYGMWWKKFKTYARDNYGVSVSDEQAMASRQYFFNTYADLEGWHKRQKSFARRNGYVRTLSGRKRRLPDALSHEDTPQRRQAERQAVNSPVQSFANEINLMAALQLRKTYGRDVVRICGTVHDAILARVRNDMVGEVTRRLLDIMKRPQLMDDFDIEMSVPILAEGKVGAWSLGVDVEKWEAACSK